MSKQNTSGTETTTLTNRSVSLVFARMNPPTLGHRKVLVTAENSADDVAVFLSKTTDSSKNPLSYEKKIKAFRMMFPDHSKYLVDDETVKTPIHAAMYLYNQGYRNVIVVGGSDREDATTKLISSYNGKVAKHGYYMFDSITSASSGDRNDGISASAARESAKNSDIFSFKQLMGDSPAVDYIWSELHEIYQT